VIVLDTHIWVWWVQESKKLSHEQARTISEHEQNIIGVSAISLWEVSKLIELKRIELPLPLEKWFALATTYPGIRIIELTPQKRILKYAHVETVE
jgi:PIN domain nuclease of toxin-antitoxin system